MALVGFPIQVIDDSGDAVPAASVAIRTKPGLALAVVYEDDSSSPSSIDNPVTVDSDGFKQVFLAAGRYRVTATWGSETRIWDIDLAQGVPAGSLTPLGAWSGATTYATRALVSHVDGGPAYLFVSLADDNLNNEPDAATPGDTASWMYAGLIGADGTDPGKLMTFDGAATADADPGTGKLRANNADLSAATVLYLDKANRAGSDLEAWLLGLDDSTSGVKGDLTITRPSDGAQASWNVTGVTDATGYVKVAVATASHAGVTSFTDLDDISVQFTPKGDAGATGASGASALTVVRLAATGNVAVASELENGDTIDGVVVATGDVVLLPAQTAPEQNGVYTVSASGAASRHTDFDAYDDLPGAVFSVMEGTANADTLWRVTSDRGGTIDSTALAISLLVAASVAEMFTASPRKHVSSANVRAAMTPAALTSGASVAVSLAAARKFTLTFDESFELQLPTDCAIGDEYVIHFTEGSGSGVTPSFASGHVFSSGVEAVINNGAGETTRLHFEVSAVSGSTATEVKVVEAGGLWA